MSSAVLVHTSTLKWQVLTFIDSSSIIAKLRTNSVTLSRIQDCGGFPSWLMNMQSKACQDNPEYKSHWEEWLTAVDKYLVPNQITQNGNIILNQIGMTQK